MGLVVRLRSNHLVQMRLNAPFVDLHHWARNRLKSLVYRTFHCLRWLHLVPASEVLFPLLVPTDQGSRQIKCAKNSVCYLFCFWPPWGPEAKRSGDGYDLGQPVHLQIAFGSPLGRGDQH